MTKPGILVFDSGVGGLSVLAEIQQIRPDADFVYVADNEFFPYGAKEETVLIERVAAVVKAVIAASDVDISIVVIACNTASTICLPRLRSILSIPVVGTVPAIKPAAAMSHSRVIGLLGTAGTVRRRYTQELIEQFAQDCHVIRVGSSALVTQAEHWLTESRIDDDVLRQEIAPFFTDDPETAKLDVIVLACTHFPLLAERLNALAPHPVTWIDSGAAIARRCDLLLTDAGYRSQPCALSVGSSLITGGNQGVYAAVFARFHLAAPGFFVP
jgi:glutamate racemase